MGLKIKSEDLKKLKELVTPLDTPERRKEYVDKGLSDKRYRWDLTYTKACTEFICQVLYKYLDDNHIDSALRSIITPIRA